MNKESDSRPASVSSLNICLFVNPTEESLNRHPDGRYGRREQAIGSFVPLLFLIGSTFDSIDWGEETIASGFMRQEGFTVKNLMALDKQAFLLISI